MPLDILGFAVDTRTRTRIVYARADIPTYLRIVGSEFDEFDIQRKRVHHKAYARMRDDIKSGALLPAITLAVKQDHIAAIQEAGDDRAQIALLVSTPGSVNILDGLQRTHTLKDIAESGHEFPPDQTVLLEIWLEPNIKNLIYRIIVLNAGQKPMSMRHQVELLFYSTKATLEHRISGLEIFTERDESRRTRAKKYPLDRISLAYYAFITRSHEVNKDNIVAQQLQEDDILSQGVERFGEQFEKFALAFEKLAIIDQSIQDKYGAPGLAWSGSENFLLSFFAAVGQTETRLDGSDLVASSLSALILQLRNSSVPDPLGFETFQRVAKGVDPRKSNVGFGTRRLIFNSFREYFRSRGETPLADIWPREAE